MCFWSLKKVCQILYNKLVVLSFCIWNKYHFCNNSIVTDFPKIIFINYTVNISQKVLTSLLKLFVGIFHFLLSTMTMFFSICQKMKYWKGRFVAISVLHLNQRTKLKRFFQQKKWKSISKQFKLILFKIKLT